MNTASATVYGERGMLRTIFSLTWPQLCALICQTIIGITDVWAAGRISSDVQASIGLIGQCQMMLLFIGFAAANGAVATVSQSFGARKSRRARRYVAFIMGMALLIGTLIGIFGLCLRSQLLSILQTPKSIYPVAYTFINATMVAMPGHYGMVIGAALFRSAQSVFLPLYAALAVCVINVIGDLCFGLGYLGCPAIGSFGIAWSTTVSVYIGTGIMLAGLIRQKLIRRNDMPNLRWACVASRYLIKVTIPALGTSILWQLGYFLMFIITSSLPKDSIAAIAGLTSGIRLESMLFMPAGACSMTASVLVGNALGARDGKKAMKIAINVLLMGCMIITVAVICLWAFRPWLSNVLSSDPQVVSATYSYLNFNLISEPCSFISIVLTGVFNGAGASMLPMRAFLISIWGVRLPLAYLLGHIIWGTCDGVFCAMMVSQFIQSFFLVWILLRKDWQRYAMHSIRRYK